MTSIFIELFRQQGEAITNPQITILWKKPELLIGHGIAANREIGLKRFLPFKHTDNGINGIKLMI